jgi:hypothetical protein
MIYEAVHWIVSRTSSCVRGIDWDQRRFARGSLCTTPLLDEDGALAAFLGRKLFCRPA